jgi:hypothetical protein
LPLKKKNLNVMDAASDGVHVYLTCHLPRRDCIDALFCILALFLSHALAKMLFIVLRNW